ncbi:hypothetical protein TIFTF001_035816 [Ficus carica]|uniref:Uncharacterized protein n=1 Tax=Ficus carica TaxID=3494 RepID=A0AA88EBH3_FICCA|nr:hypothetical protein TIFTF001_035800 [Ficus carica]GMN66749.1 hypothetical protein TIFTF001_035816 [Ficus carica]
MPHTVVGFTMEGFLRLPLSKTTSFEGKGLATGRVAAEIEGDPQGLRTISEPTRHGLGFSKIREITGHGENRHLCDCMLRLRSIHTAEGGNPDLHREDRPSLHSPNPREIQISIASCSSPLSVLDEGEEKISSVGVRSTGRPSSPFHPEPSRLFCREPSRPILLGGSGNFYFQFFLSFFSTGDGSHELHLWRRVREGEAGGEVINGEGAIKIP